MAGSTLSKSSPSMEAKPTQSLHVEPGNCSGQNQRTRLAVGSLRPPPFSTGGWQGPGESWTPPSPQVQCPWRGRPAGLPMPRVVACSSRNPGSARHPGGSGPASTSSRTAPHGPEPGLRAGAAVAQEGKAGCLWLPHCLVPRAPGCEARGLPSRPAGTSAALWMALLGPGPVHHAVSEQRGFNGCGRGTGQVCPAFLTLPSSRTQRAALRPVPFLCHRKTAVCRQQAAVPDEASREAAPASRRCPAHTMPSG